MLTNQEILLSLRAKADQLGSQMALAKTIKITPAYLSDILAGKRDPGKTVLKYLGLKRRVIYVKLPTISRTIRSQNIRRMSALVSIAIKNGKLKHPTLLKCVDCGKPATEYDHRDYSKPLNVDPVCHSCNLKRGPGKGVMNILPPLPFKGHSAAIRQLKKGGPSCFLDNTTTASVTGTIRRLGLQKKITTRAWNNGVRVWRIR